MTATASHPTTDRWPELPFEDWKDTAATLHMWTQIVGKIRMVQTPWINHSWSVALYVSPRGLTTSPIPHGDRRFQIDFDFLNHQLLISSSDDKSRTIPLEPQTTADFYAQVMGALTQLEMPVEIYAQPNEVEEAIPFAEDEQHASYDAEAAQRFWRALLQVDRIFTKFRAGFLGKSSPSHFFWGSFDLAVTRFSGRTAPEHPGGYPNMPLDVMREAYSHEVSSAGFWPGGEQMPFPIFYSYAYPTPEGFSEVEVKPEGAKWNPDLGEFVLPYDEVRRATSPDQMLMEFLETTYKGAARLADWDIQGLEQTFRQ
ncbi:MAG: hypothetical protein EP299_03160 [Acidobacteria bacterium]|nr:MAG: hypothetical protein EP299_03160 [Acidobacteriota bacterium]